MRKLASLALVFTFTSLFALPAAVVYAAPRYYIHVRAVEMAPSVSKPEAGATPAVSREQELALARELFTQALRKHPDVTLDLDASPDNPEQTAAELKRKNLKGYEVTLRFLQLSRAVNPPPAGKQFRVLEQNVKLSVVGTIFPGAMLALGGDGESTVQTEVGVQVSERQEREVLNDALRDAIEQAVTQALRKLKAGPMKPPKDAPRRKKK